MTDDVETLKCVVNDLYHDRPGQMALLDHFAALAMQSLLGSEKWWNNTNSSTETTGTYARRTADTAYDVAEAMLRERAARLSKGEQ